MRADVQLRGFCCICLCAALMAFRGSCIAVQQSGPEHVAYNVAMCVLGGCPGVIQHAGVCVMHLSAGACPGAHQLDNS